MIDFIQSETKRIMYKCCKRHSEKQKMNIEDVQLILGVNEDGNTYTICENYQPKEHLDILGVLGFRIDFGIYSKIAPPFIIKSLVRFSNKYNFPLENSKVMCLPNVEKGINLYLYNNNDYLETITFQDLFQEDDFEMPI